MKKQKTTPERKYPVSYYIIALAIPVMFFLLLELGLRIASPSGEAAEQWVPVNREHQEFLTLNPDIAKKYFVNSPIVPQSIGDYFRREKPGNGFRVFVLGESSAAGFPYEPTGAFSRYLQYRLELLYPNKTIEVVNTGMAAITTNVILDLLPGILEQSPDLILIYTGHNEYYGALGAASRGESDFILAVNDALEHFRTYQLLRGLLSSDEAPAAADASNEGLMEQLAKEQFIPYESAMYRRGVEQFEENLELIAAMIADKGIPVVIGNLACNLRDQAPFESPEGKADAAFRQAAEQLSKQNTVAALEKYKEARDLDQLRFRAPGEFNSVISRVAAAHEFPVVEVEKMFNTEGQLGVVGSELMTDHLHPNLKGYQLLGKSFFTGMQSAGLLPEGIQQQAPQDVQHEQVVRSFPFSSLDSSIARMRITSLKSRWPFVEERRQNLSSIVQRRDRIDSLAYRVTFENLDWRTAHRKAADWFLQTDDLVSFLSECRAVIAQYPYLESSYRLPVEELIGRERFGIALSMLQDMNRVIPGSFSNKWLGSISLQTGRPAQAIRYLTAALDYEQRDPQAWFNLALAYVKTGNRAEALRAVDYCLSLDPNYPQGMKLKNALQASQ